uniref:Cadherin domain-containing protein n=1 Tax=Cyprinus carpio TaxID=7962 RepID=A0A8C1W9V1_CYPCA
IFVQIFNLPKKDTTTLTVRFQNDTYFPHVVVQVYKDVLSEDSPKGTLVVIVTAETQRNAPVSFYLASGNFGEVFELHHSTGELTVKDPIDFESNMHFHLIVEARDSGIPPFSSYAELNLNISDVNDNPPVFSQNIYKCEVYENMASSRVCNVLATDADSGVFAEVEYSILAGNIEDAFKIDKIRGILSTTKRLDREKIPHYNLTLKAIDKENNSLSATAAVIIVVLDTNDHAPRFSQIFITEVPEDAPLGFSIIQITATDEDVGLNAVIEYTIIRDIHVFYLDTKNGTITTSEIFDYEQKQHFELTVKATNIGFPYLFDIARIRIQIAGLNEFIPAFQKHIYNFTVSEALPPQTEIGRVVAIDYDQGYAHITHVINHFVCVCVCVCVYLILLIGCKFN